MSDTLGLNHLGLTVNNLDATTQFFVDCLGWEESGRDNSYPRTAVSDGTMRLTLWQADQSLQVARFDRRKNIGLHHLAITVPSKAALTSLADRVKNWKNVEIEFMPELVGKGPRMHMMFAEPGGIRLELIWSGEDAAQSR